jgi:phosphoglycolate phosphatase-like HAD superfamily hydrolase
VVGASWMVGDTDADVTAGKVTGCMTLLIRHPDSVHKRLQAVTSGLLADSLANGTARLAARILETIELD